MHSYLLFAFRLPGRGSCNLLEIAGLPRKQGQSRDRRELIFWGALLMGVGCEKGEYMGIR